MPCRLRQDGGCKNATLGLQVCVHNDFQIRFYSFHNRDEIFFLPVPNNKDLLKIKGLFRDWCYDANLQMPEGSC